MRTEILVSNTKETLYREIKYWFYCFASVGRGWRRLSFNQHSSLDNETWKLIEKECKINLFQNIQSQQNIKREKNEENCKTFPAKLSGFSVYRFLIILCCYCSLYYLCILYSWLVRFLQDPLDSLDSDYKANQWSKRKDFNFSRKMNCSPRVENTKDESYCISHQSL